MIDPRLELPEEHRPQAYHCPECGDLRDENEIEVYGTPRNLRYYDIVTKLCKNCIPKPNVWDVIIDELKDIIKNLNKQKV
jgi:hypothetical protein